MQIHFLTNKKKELKGCICSLKKEVINKFKSVFEGLQSRTAIYMLNSTGITLCPKIRILSLLEIKKNSFLALLKNYVFAFTFF